MAIAHVRENAASTSFATAATYTHTVTTPASGNILVLTVTEAVGTAPLGGTPSGVATTWTSAGSVAQTGTLLTTEVWVGTGPFSGTTVTITKKASADAAACSSHEFSGASGTPRAAAVTASGAASTGTYPGASLTATAVGDLLFQGAAWRDAALSLTSGPGGGYSIDTGETSGARANPTIRPVYQITTDTSAHQPTIVTPSGGTNAWNYVGIVIPVASTTFTKSVSGSVSSSGALALAVTRVKSFSGSTSPSGTVVRQPQKKAAGSITPSGALALKTNPQFVSGHAADSGRDWGSPYQDVTITFDDSVADAAFAVGAAAAGHTIKVNGTSYTPTYRSGSGTATLVLRVAVLVHNGDTITYSYSRSAGATMGTVGEVAVISDAAVTNDLTTRVRFVVRDRHNALVASTTCKYWVGYYNSGNVLAAGPGGRSWMTEIDRLTPTTDASGVLDVLIDDPNVSVGTTVVVVIYQPDSSPVESFTWPVDVV